MKRLPKTTVMSMRINPDQQKRLKKLARRLGRVTSDTCAFLIEEGLRRSEFPFIDFRDSAMGRQAFVIGTRLPVWQVITIHRDLGEDVKKTSHYFGWGEIKVRAVTNYALAFKDEINELIHETNEIDFEGLRRDIPHIEKININNL